MQTTHDKLLDKVRKFGEIKGLVSEDSFKGVYIFASFDLANSTKIKYRDSKWIALINQLIDSSISEWFGLKFWKYNGDEILYYSEVTAISQIAKILHQIYIKSNDIREKLLKMMINDESLGFACDLVGIKTAVWIAYVSNDNNAVNSMLDTSYIDFAGINMDEGFRMSKCAIQNKIVVDPKIAFLICLATNEIYSGKSSNVDPYNYTKSFETKEYLRSIDEVFGKFCVQNYPISSDYDDLFKVVANNFRVVGYEKCKGVWEDRPYPIIWYSDNWDSSIEEAKYDEVYSDKLVTKELINFYYNDYEHSYLDTLKILKKIYNSVRIFAYVIDKILLESNFKFCASYIPQKQYSVLTYLYYSIVCINKKTGGVLAFLRSNYRGHLPGVWDFEQQKNIHPVDGSESVVLQIEERFKKNFDINIKVVKDLERNSVIPMDIHPIYRRGKMHTGILCFAYIDEEDLSEQDILARIKSRINEVKSGYDYPFYADAKFIHADQLKFDDESKKTYISIDDKKITELTYPDILDDSNTWHNHNKENINKDRCTPNFVLTVRDALCYKEKKKCHEGESD